MTVLVSAEEISLVNLTQHLQFCPSAVFVAGPVDWIGLVCAGDKLCQPLMISSGYSSLSLQVKTVVVLAAINLKLT